MIMKNVDRIAKYYASANTIKQKKGIESFARDVLASTEFVRKPNSI